MLGPIRIRVLAHTGAMLRLLARPLVAPILCQHLNQASTRTVRGGSPPL